MSTQSTASSAQTAVEASAPGRVNLIGEHTDYNDGFVLPMPIPQQTTVRLEPREDDQVLLESADESGLGSYRLGHELKSGKWIDYVQGVTRALAERGHQLRGFSAHVSSNVPIGAGLSSSAALEVAMLRALRQAYALRVDDLTIAKLGQIAEVEFVGAPTGIMDQMASSLGEPDSALFIDTRTLQTRLVSLPPSLEPVVIASGVTHAHGTGDYRTRRSECERAAAALGVGSLRDVTREQLEAAGDLEPVLMRRARHVISENARVLATLQAFEACDASTIGKLFAASHVSMRDDYEVSVAEIDLLVALGDAHPAIIAARLTGGGFGGSVVMLAERGKGLAAAHEIASRYESKTRRQPSILLPLER